ncbi:MAG: hypothetical protein NC418_02375 [Muribaculaceae bacterium]|nr:hypothetical protein [Muribaculaceae bacterium]
MSTKRTLKSFSLGFYFSPKDELRIMRAIKEATEYMNTYGKGRAPYMVDLSHYENTKQSYFHIERTLRVPEQYENREGEATADVIV